MTAIFDILLRIGPTEVSSGHHSTELSVIEVSLYLTVYILKSVS
jgi:hypothetical protein